MNGYGKQILVGVAVIVLATVIIGSGSATISTAVALGKTEVIVEQLKTEVSENTEVTQGIDVMQRQIDTIELNVGKILEKLEK